MNQININTMAKTETIAGVVPVPRGPYDSGNTYYKYNLTQLYGSTYMSKIDDNTTAPATMDAEGNITVNENWEVWADASGIQALQKEIEKRYKTIGFAGIVDDAISSASSEEDGSPSNVYYSSQLKAFVLKSGEVYYTTWNNAGLWNDVSDEGSMVSYSDCYYIKNGKQYVFNGTELKAIGGGSVEIAQELSTDEGSDKKVLSLKTSSKLFDEIDNTLNGNKPITEQIQSEGGSYKKYYFSTPMPLGSVISTVKGSGYLLQDDDNYDSSVMLQQLELPYTTAKKYIGVYTNVTGEVSITYLFGNETEGVKEEIEKLKSDVENLKNIENGDVKDYIQEISGEYDSFEFAYITSNSGLFNSQSEETGRKVLFYKASANDEFIITGVLPNASIFTYIATYDGAVKPSNRDVCNVIQSYGDGSTISIVKNISFKADGWLLIGLLSSSFEKRNVGDWRVYKKSKLKLESLCTPKEITAVVGDTIQIYRRALTNAIDIRTFDLLTSCNKGNSYPRYWEFKPTLSDVGTYTINTFLKNASGQILDMSDIVMNVVSSPKNPSSMVKIAIFGDSLTQGGQWVTELHRRLSSNDEAAPEMPAGSNLANIKLIGAMGVGDAKYFGVGGWGWKSYATSGTPAFRFQVTGVSTIIKDSVYTNNGFDYTIQENNTTDGTGNILCTTSSASNVPSASGVLTRKNGNGDETIQFTSVAADVSNPIWDNDLNDISFEKYLNNIGEDTFDCAIFLLGWNDIFNDKYYYDDYMFKVLRKFHEQYPAAKVMLLGLQFPSLNGGLGTNYGSKRDGYSDKYHLIRSVIKHNAMMQEICDSEEFSSYCIYVDVASQFDSEWNMPYTEVSVNTRNNVTEIRGTNGVHPANAGYLQIADVVWRAVVKNFCQ